MKKWVAVVLPLTLALCLLAEVIPTIRRGGLRPAHVAALMVAGICIGIAGAAVRGLRR
jgi:hypothetical protein